MLDKSPVLTTFAEQTFIKDRFLFGNCLRGCKWAPDGSCLCTNSDDHRIRIFNLPAKFLNQDDDVINETTTIVDEISPDLELREAQIIYDYCWYPLMKSSDAATCFLLCCSRGAPVHLWDAYSGQISATYLAVNNVHELASARSVQFTRCGTTIVAGYEKFICLFSLSSPGQTGDYIYEAPNGIVSCLATGTRVLAAGSFGKLIGLYDTGTRENIAMVQGHRGGLTHLALSPDDLRLYSGARKDSEILCWDLRNYGSILHIIKRNCTTNQRIYFDINFEKDLLATGDSDGIVRLFDLKTASDEDNHLQCSGQFRSHDNCVNGVSLHPTLPLMATASGQRCLLDFNETEDELMFDYSKSYIRDNNLKLWRFR